METTLEIPKAVSREVSVASGFVAEARALVITTQHDLSDAADLRTRIKDASKAFLAKKEDLVRPQMEALARLRALFKPAEEHFAEALRIISKEVLEYQAREAEKNAEPEEKTVSGASGKMTTRTVTKVRVTDESKLPREYLIPDMVKIANAILREGKKVRGAEKYEHKILAG